MPVAPLSAARPRRAADRRLRFGLPALAALAVLLVVLVPSTGATFTSKAVNGGSSMGAAEFFTCSAAVLSDGPRLYYKLDDTSGTQLVDSSGQGRNGTYYGSPSKGRADACARDNGSAVLFNGSSAYASYGTSLQIPTTLSVEAWVQTTSTRGGVVACFGASPTGASLSVDRVLYLTNAGRVAFGVNYLSRSATITTTAVNDGRWHHLLATLGPSGTKIYVDGVESASSTTTASATYTGYFRVGYDSITLWPSAPTSSYLNATLDEVAVYVTQLSADDAATHYSAGL